MMKKVHSLSHLDFFGSNMATTTAPAAARQISRDELRKHASPDSMWIAIDGDVYDVTSCGCLLSFGLRHSTPPHPGASSSVLAVLHPASLSC